MAFTEASPPAPESRPRRPGPIRRRHEEAVVQAEARRLARALAPYRILHRRALERVVGAPSWHEGGFDRALGAAVRAGVIEPLPGGFVRDARPGGDSRSDARRRSEARSRSDARPRSDVRSRSDARPR